MISEFSQDERPRRGEHQRYCPLSLAYTMAKQQQLLAAYSYDPAVPLPPLSEQDLQQIGQMPDELVQHFVQDRKSNLIPHLIYLRLYKNELFSTVLLTYEGPLVYANQMLMRLDNGGKGVPAPCFFCGEWLVDILEHMKSKHEQEILAKFADRRSIGPTMTITQYRSHLVAISWLKNHNYMVWWHKKGVLIPHMGSNDVTDPSSMIFCSFCCILLEKNTWDAHCESCIPIQSMQEKPSLRRNRLRLYDM